ncbi:hypothetical protein SAMN05216480_111123 [Pustulibacterium marinum]|uniref:Uncharacterized protein n=1 Tax=Pustulibacterium marinum TaxID=1224947 RepID=A0A1I7HY41_9FLAO|nr:hypothetical protein [Pustulibacterium marinum]SFU65406.1 hypothetical protein SAMN05216480_111123 [Pustulibacterium marinum]
MQILFIVLGFIGLTMTFFGVKWTVTSFKAKEISCFPFNNLKKEFEIKRPGQYTLSIIGGGFVGNTSNFHISVKTKDHQKIVDYEENFMRPRFRKNGKIGVEYLQFKISDSGLYKVEIENPEDLIVKKSIVKTKQFFQAPLAVENIEISIGETIPISKKLFGIIFLVLGVNISVWGIILGINPQLFG